MSELIISGTNLGTSLNDLLVAPDMQPGAEPSYQLAKTIYLYHPLGAKMAESPILMAQSQQRDIAIPDSPEDRVKEAFLTEWRKIGADKHIFNVARLSRVYGIASVALLVKDLPSNEPIDYNNLWQQNISFNVFDPLNTSGSLVLNQEPNSLDFLKTTTISVGGDTYHRSRVCIKLNEEPIYLGYTTSAFGFVGRSVYQRALYPLRSFIHTMVTDDMVSRKAGLLIIKLKQPGSIIDSLMQRMAGIKRSLLLEAQTNNVMNISNEDDIETLNLQNIDGAVTTSRENILKNIATAADMPSKLLSNEALVQGFGEGTEDAKNIAKYIDGIRVELEEIYAFFDRIVQYRAWNPDFYKTIQADFPQYQSVPYNQAFYQWRNSFVASWPSLLIEPESERIKVDEAKLQAVTTLLEKLAPLLDPKNTTGLVQWAADNFNELKLLFGSPLEIDAQALVEYMEQQAQQGAPVEEEMAQAMNDSQHPVPFKNLALRKVFRASR